MDVLSSRSSSPTRKHRFQTLDGLRGIAALMVAIGHLASEALPNTGLAVDFFFMLSGFVLLHAYSGRLAAGMKFASYVRARLVRLLPLVLFGTILGALTSANYKGILGTFLIPLRGPLMYPLDPPCWSLLFELIASLLLGAGLWRRWTRVNIAMMACFGLLMIVAVIHRGSIAAGWALESFHYGIVRVIFGFSVGACIYHYRPSISAPPMVLASALTLVLVVPVSSPAYQIFVLVLVLPLILAAGANASPMPFSRLLGEISYPLYIIHIPLFALAPFFGPISRLVAAIGVSLIVVRLYDEPVRAWLSRSRPLRVSQTNDPLP